MNEDLMGISHQDMVGYPNVSLSKDQILDNADKLDIIKTDAKIDPSIEGINPSMNRFQETNSCHR
jgi:hypothetical protein